MSIADLAAQAAELHAKTTGRMPAVTAFAPGRVNLMGEHTDYNGGLVLPIALSRGSVAAASRRADDLVVVASEQAGGVRHEFNLAALESGPLDGWPAYVAGAVGAAVARGWLTGGVDVAVSGNVPIGAGLSSSASLECATLVAVTALAEREVPRVEVALAAQETEHRFAGVPCGVMDQSVAMLAVEGSGLLLDSGTLRYQHVPLRLNQMGMVVVIVDTGARHELNDGRYAERRSECERAAEALGVHYLADLGLDDLGRIEALPEPIRRRARHIVTENVRVEQVAAAFAAADIARIGSLFAESHASMANDFEISCAELDVTVSAALDGGASAARMTGGGFGGSAVVLCAPARVDAVRASVESAFAAKGFASPSLLFERPEAGARIVEI